MLSARRLKNQNGFSLIEMTIVVAIMSILAVLGITQYSKMKLKTRETEAKTALSALYAAEIAFQSEFNFYHTSLASVGFSLHGKVYFNVGFGIENLTSAGLYNYPTNPAKDAIISTAQICTGANATGTDTDCKYMVLIPPIDAAATSTTNYFVAAAVSLPELYANKKSVDSSWIALLLNALTPTETHAQSVTPLIQNVWSIDSSKVLVSGYPRLSEDCPVLPAVEISPGIWMVPMPACTNPILTAGPSDI